MTTAISMDVAAELGGIAALTGAIVIVTGIVGALPVSYTHLDVYKRQA